MSKTLLKFSAEWCKNCKPLTQIIENSGVSLPIKEYDIDVDFEIASRYKVRGIPTLVLLDDTGYEITRHTGLLNQEQLIKFCGK